ncbi:hypothetical protein K440DRAFT_637287 [Wilcoxina mikolae CBS 423.85]|nr:hypothetical protein K440DRAFT_637287 [Wilcoxina mikolae CBS 423.85]
MDPFSVAVSILSILAVSERIAQTLYSFTRSATDVPESVSRVHAEVQIVRAVFIEIQRFLQGDFGEVDETRVSLIPLHDTLLTGCNRIFSELEKYIVDDAGKPTVWERVKWAAKESEIESLMGDLQRHKLSLNLILGITNMHSSSAIANGIRRFLSVPESPANHLRGGGDDSSIAIESRTVFDDNDGPPTRAIRPIIKRNFESELRNTWPYRKERVWNGSTVSVQTSDRKGSGVSQLNRDELSVEELSVLGLPMNSPRTECLVDSPFQSNQYAGRTPDQSLAVTDLRKLISQSRHILSVFNSYLFCEVNYFLGSSKSVGLVQLEIQAIHSILKQAETLIYGANGTGWLSVKLAFSASTVTDWGRILFELEKHIKELGRLTDIITSTTEWENVRRKTRPTQKESEIEMAVMQALQREKLGLNLVLSSMLYKITEFSKVNNKGIPGRYNAEARSRSWRKKMSRPLSTLDLHGLTNRRLLM